MEGRRVEQGGGGDGVEQRVGLVKELLEKLPQTVSSKTSVVFGDVESALAASDLLAQQQVAALDDPDLAPPPSPFLLIVAPSPDQVCSSRSFDTRALLSNTEQIFWIPPPPSPWTWSAKLRKSESWKKQGVLRNGRTTCFGMRKAWEHVPADGWGEVGVIK